MVFTKICGIRSQEDLDKVSALNFDSVGFMFYERSKRFIDAKTAGTLFSPPESIKRVGVFVNLSAESINSIAKEAKLDLVQLHGEEPIEILEKVNLPVIKALPVYDKIPSLQKWCNHPKIFAVLLDYGKSKKFGGTGISFNWELLDQIPQETMSKKLIIAGGLNPKNVSSLIQKWRPFGIDLSSGVESKSGQGKDQALLTELKKSIQI